MATSTYDLHDKTFANVSAFVIVKNGERVATIAFKYPKDAAGRLYAYAHWIGEEMTRGCASGAGYHKTSAAVEHALRDAKPDLGQKNDYADFVTALREPGGSYWDHKLRDAGFDVWQAV